MKFIETELKGAYIIELEPIEDERGFFARTFCQEEFKKAGIEFNIVQCNISYNKKKEQFAVCITKICHILRRR